MSGESRILKMLRESGGDPSYHPLCALLSLTNDQMASVQDKINIHKTIAKYVEPELRQVEYSGPKDKPPITMRVVLQNDDGSK